MSKREETGLPAANGTIHVNLNCHSAALSANHFLVMVSGRPVTLLPSCQRWSQEHSTGELYAQPKVCWRLLRNATLALNKHLTCCSARSTKGKVWWLRNKQTHTRLQIQATAIQSELVKREKEKQSEHEAAIIPCEQSLLIRRSEQSSTTNLSLDDYILFPLLNSNRNALNRS